MRRLFNRLCNSKYHFALILTLSVVIITSGLGLRDPWTPDEPRFAIIAKQMVESGNWLIPHRGVEIYADKPPIFIWAIAIFYKIFGSINIAFLLPSLLASVAVLLMVYDLGRRLWSAETGLIAAIVLLGTYQFGLQAKSAQIDMTLTFFTTLALYGLMRTLFLQHNVRWVYLSFFSMGLGVLTKGVGFLPLFLLVPYFLTRLNGWNYSTRYSISSWQWLYAVFLFIAPLAVWLSVLLAQMHITKNADLSNYFNNILFQQTKIRYFDSWAHLRPYWYLIVQALQLWMPLTLLLPWFVFGWYKQFLMKDARVISLLVWVSLVILFFSLSPGKRGVYILPALPAFVVACSPILVKIRKSLSANALSAITVFVISVFFIYIPYLCTYDTLSCPGFVSNDVKQFFIVILILGFAGQIIITLTATRHSILGMFVFVITFWFIVGWWAYPELNKIKSERYIIEETVKIIGPSAELGFVAWRDAFLLYTDRNIKEFGFSKSFEEQSKTAIKWQIQKNNRWLLTRKSVVDCCFNIDRAVYVGTHERRDWYLINSP